jgi:DHA1 family bicyclomycin/chloramphenicol resistance-like MFS transporter
MATFGATLASISYFLLPETHPPERRPRLHVPALARTAAHVARDGEFLLLAFAMGANFAAMMCYIGAAPTVVLDRWHLGETQFAWLFLPIISGFVIGAWISGRMAGRFPLDRQSLLGFALSITGSALSVTLNALMVPPIPAQQALLLMMALGVQLVSPTLTLRMLDLFPHARGSAASVQSCISIVISAMVFGVLAPLVSGSLLTLGEASLCAALAGFGLWRAARYRVSLAHGPS